MLSSLYTLATIARLRDDVELNPTTRGPGGEAGGIPGGEAMQTLINWLGQYGLWITLAALIAGGALFAWAKQGSGGRMAFSASMLAIGGAVGALLVGLAPDLINTFHDLGT